MVVRSASSPARRTAGEAISSGGASETAQVFSLDSGDVLPEEEGDELIAVDERYSVNLIKYDETTGEWSTDILWKDADWLYEVDIGELAGGPEQVEIVVVGEQKRATMLSRSGNSWIPTTIATDMDIFEACWIADIYKDRPGNEVLLGGGRGIVFTSHLEGGLWKQTEIMDVEEQITDLLAADIDTTIQGEEVYASTITGDVWKIWMDGGNWTRSLVHSEGKLIYGMETGEIQGVNVLSIGTWNNRVGIIWYDGSFQFQEVYREEYLVMGTAILDIDPAYDGNEILSLSYLGRVTMIYQEEPGAEIVLPFTSTTVKVGETVRIPMIIESRGGYEGEVRLSLENELSAVDATLPQGTIDAGSLTYLQIEGLSPYETPSQFITIHANTSLSASKRVVFISVNDEGTSFDAMDPVLETSVNADGQTPLSVDLVNREDSSFTVEYYTRYVPTDITIDGINSSFSMGEGNSKLSGTISAEAWVTVGDYRFFMVFRGSGGTIRAVGIEATVNERLEPNFRLQLGDAMISIPLGGNATVPLNVIAENNFEGNVSISYSPPIPGVNISLSKAVIRPTGSIDLTVEAFSDEGDYLLTIRGISGELKAEAYLFMRIEPPPRYVDFEMDENGYGFSGIDDDEVSSEFWILLIPRNGELKDLTIDVEGIPQNFSITYAPQSIQSLFYPINVTFVVKGPKDEAPEFLIISIEGSEEGPWRIEVPMEVDDNDDKGEDDGPPYILIVIIGSMVLIAAGAGMYFQYRSSRDLNREEGVEGQDDGDRRALHSRSAPSQRFNGSRSGRDRFHH